MPAIWHIYHIKNSRHTTPSKNKLVIIVCISVKYMGFFINTDISNFVKNRPDLLACQVVIKASEHKCLKYDSYVDCAHIYPFEDAELSDIRDSISNHARTKIRKAVALSKTIEGCYKEII
jgi:hypothetical protein